jgi:hypothetical protein
MFYYTKGQVNSIKECIEECTFKAIPLVRDMDEALLDEELVFVKTDEGQPHRAFNGGIIKLEANLLDLGASPTVCEGVFYMFPVTIGNRICLRYAK